MGNSQAAQTTQRGGAVDYEPARIDNNTLNQAARYSDSIYKNGAPPSGREHYTHEEDEAQCRPTKWAIYSQNNRIFIVFRGSKIAIDWVLNLSVAGLLYVDRPNGDLRVHPGYWGEIDCEYNEIVGMLIAAIIDLENEGNAIDNIVVTGHSKGGGLSQLFLFRLLRDENPELIRLGVRKKSLAITFAAPMVFAYSEESLAGIERANSRIHNFVVASDIVPHLPLLLHSNIYAVKTLVDGHVGLYSLLPGVSSIRRALLDKASDIAKWLSIYRPVGTLYTASFLRPGSEENVFFAKMSHAEFISMSKSRDLRLDLAHHRMQKYLKIVANETENYKSMLIVAESGDSMAQWQVGKCLQNGKGVEKSETAAFEWYWWSAAQGHQQAQLNVALYFAYGLGSAAVNADKAMSFYELAASHTTPTKELPEIAIWWQYELEQEHTEHACDLGLCYQYGRCGVLRNEAEAVKLYQLSVAQGKGTGQALLGLCYQYGRCGVAKDEAEAGWLYGQSAAQGNSIGQALLGLCYQNGRCGAAKDEAEALLLYQLSAAQGNSIGQALLGLCYQYGECGVAEDEAEAVRLYRLSAAQDCEYDQALSDDVINVSMA